MLADVVGDAAENLFVTGSFFARLAIWMAQGKKPSAFLEDFQTVPFTYSVSAHPHRLLSFVYLLVAGTVAGTAVLLASAAVMKSFHARDSTSRKRFISLWPPVGMFWAINAAAFSLTANLVHIRWVLFSHFICPVMLYSPASGSSIGQQGKGNIPPCPNP